MHCTYVYAGRAWYLQFSESSDQAVVHAGVLLLHLRPVHGRGGWRRDQKLLRPLRQVKGYTPDSKWLYIRKRKEKYNVKYAHIILI